jgi:glycosyltransferase involved in cell wall biosynthesis
MKIIKVIGSLDFGGIEKVFEITARYFPGDKQDILFLCLGEGGAAEKAIRALGYRVIVWGAKTKVPQPRLILRLKALFRRERPDVVHTTGAEANFHGMVAAWLCRIPVRVAEEIGMPKHSAAARYIFKMVYAMSTKVIAVAGLVKDFLLESGEVPLSKIVVIYNPVDVKAFTQIRPGDPDSLFRVVTVCRLDPIKNLGLLIRGVGAAGDMPMELWLVGDGPSRTSLEGLVRELGVGHKVTFWGYQSQPATFLERASAFILPSFSEGIPLSVAEAMLTGTPCAVTRVGGAPEFILDGENGWLLDPNDQEGFNNLLKRIAGMPIRERLEVGENGKRTAMEKFQPDQYLKRIWDIYALAHYGKNKDITLP